MATQFPDTHMKQNSVQGCSALFMKGIKQNQTKQEHRNTPNVQQQQKEKLDTVHLDAVTKTGLTATCNSRDELHKPDGRKNFNMNYLIPLDKVKN